jgi:hypothetical protein
MTPRSSCSGEESIPLQGANLRLEYEINNVTDTALGNLARGDTLILPVWSRPQLQTAWVTFGKQRRVSLGARRSGRQPNRAISMFALEKRDHATGQKHPSGRQMLSRPQDAGRLTANELTV